VSEHRLGLAEAGNVREGIVKECREIDSCAHKTNPPKSLVRRGLRDVLVVATNVSGRDDEAPEPLATEVTWENPRGRSRAPSMGSPRTHKRKTAFAGGLSSRRLAMDAQKAET
jgi:hypothetical protein